MRIAYMSSSIIPSQTANSVQVMKMCQAFAANGHEVTMFTPDRRDEELAGIDDCHGYYGVARTFTIRFIPYFNPQKKRWRNLVSTLSYVLHIAMQLHSYKPDIVYGRSLPACFVATKCGYRTVLECHGPVGISRIDAWLFRQITGCPTAYFVTISKALRQLLAVQEGLPAHRTAIAHDGSDAPLLHNTRQSELNTSGPLLVGYIGSLYEGRGINLILQLARRFQDMEFRIVGGSKADVTRWQEHNPPDNIIFYGHLPHAKTEAIRLACDILLAPYRPGLSVAGGGGDTSAFMSPLKIFEYMASGKAILCSDLPVLREVLDEQTALLVPPNDIKAWTVGLDRLRNANLRDRLGSAAMQEFLTKYTWTKRAENVLTFGTGVV